MLYLGGHLLASNFILRKYKTLNSLLLSAATTDNYKEKKLPSKVSLYSSLLGMLKLFNLHSSLPALDKSVKLWKNNDFVCKVFCDHLPFLQVSSAFDSLDGCLTNWWRLPCWSEGLVASNIWPSAADHGRVSAILNFRRSIL